MSRSTIRSGLLAWLVTALSLTSCKGAPSFESAQQDATRRGAYLETVQKKARLPDHVAGIEYRTPESLYELLPETRGINPLPGMITVPDDLRKEAPLEGGARSRIIVLPNAFDASQVESETVFLLGLLDHEGAHARVNWSGFAEPALRPEALRALPEPLPQWLFSTASELVAHRKELEAAKPYNLPPTYWRKAYGAYLIYYLRLLRPPAPLPEALRDHLLIDFFQPWMRSLENLVRDDTGWRFVVDGADYALPPAVVGRIAGDSGSP